MTKLELLLDKKEAEFLKQEKEIFAEKKRLADEKEQLLDKKEAELLSQEQGIFAENKRLTDAKGWLLKKETEFLAERNQFLEEKRTFLEEKIDILERKVSKLKDTIQEYENDIGRLQQTYKETTLPFFVRSKTPLKIPIMVWEFDDAPEEIRKMSKNGGDEDWIAYIPSHYIDNHIIDIPDLTERHNGSLGDIDTQEYLGKGIIQIKSHA